MIFFTVHSYGSALGVLARDGVLRMNSHCHGRRPGDER
jgi:hypothetical protein